MRGVLDSWTAPKAREYRRLHDLPDTLGTGGHPAAHGVRQRRRRLGLGRRLHPRPRDRRPATLCRVPARRAGRDIVSGRRTPDGAGQLALLAPDVHARLETICHALEAEFRDSQEFEFTVQDGELFLLQTRTAKRTPWAALRIAVDQAGEGLISTVEARERLAGLDLDSIRRAHVRGGDEADTICQAQPVSMGVASGPIALDVTAAQRIAQQGRAPLLIRRDTSTEDLAGMVIAAGLLTRSGGRTSHAAVVARELASPASSAPARSTSTSSTAASGSGTASSPRATS